MYYIYPLIFMYPGFAIDEAGASPNLYSVFLPSNKKIVFCWVPSHVSIRDSEKVDLAAKAALNLSNVNLGIPSSDLKCYIDKYVMLDW